MGRETGEEEVILPEAVVPFQDLAEWKDLEKFIDEDISEWANDYGWDVFTHSSEKDIAYHLMDFFPRGRSETHPLSWGAAPSMEGRCNGRKAEQEYSQKHCWLDQGPS